MLESSAAYREAVTGDARRVRLTAIVDISDPNKKFSAPTTSPETAWSKKDQLNDYDMSTPPRYATGERNRWLLDGTFDIYPDDYALINQEVGYGSEAMSGEDGTLSSPIILQSNFSGVRVLQAFSVYFSNDPVDGFPTDFTVNILSGKTSQYSQAVSNNTERELTFKGFTVQIPDSIKVTVTKWSIPIRHVRATEIVVGYFEKWSLSELSGFSVSMQGKFDCLTLPYGTATLSMDNTDRRFEPRKKDSMFQSIEERQGVDLSIGIDTKMGTEYKPIGKYFQSGNGWKTSTNAPTMTWNLVDIIGLVSGRAYISPNPLPTTLEGWIKSVILQLGDAFADYYRIDPAYAPKSVIANGEKDVTGKTCGDIIRWVCMATGTWPRARQEDGALTVEPLWNEGNKYTLEALTNYPAMSANESIAALIFRLADGNNTEYVVSGNSAASEKTVTIENPFIHTKEQAREAAKLILSCYGGNILEFNGRGDPSSEIGDVDTVWVDQSSAVTARRMAQTFQFQDGVMQDCKSTALQADGSYLYSEYVLLTESGTWTSPEGVTRIRLTIGGGGQGGGYGEDGYIRHDSNSVEAGYGAQGQNGSGGSIWYGTVDINSGQTFEVSIGTGGAPATAAKSPGQTGTATTFGQWSSANGKVYPAGFTDVVNGRSFGRTGVAAPISGSGDGGKGGAGGTPGEGYIYYAKEGFSFFVPVKDPGKGKQGVPGASGFVLIVWDKPTG